MSIQSINPATGEVVEVFEETSQQALERTVAAAREAFLEWRSVPHDTRAKCMRNAA